MSKKTSMTKQDAARIQSSEAKTKGGCVRKGSFAARAQSAARRDIRSYLMGYYNQLRPHAFNRGLAPVAAEEKLKNVSGIS